jgi:hypothetical protein
MTVRDGPESADQEVREIDEALKRSKKRDQFDLVQKFAMRIDDLRRGLLDHLPRIVHFSGHGTGLDGIALENENGELLPVPIDALAHLFQLCADHVDCVVLNACESDLQAQAISKHIPYVIGMTSTVSDDAAREFAVGFYDAIGAGKSIQAAFKFGCNAIALKGIPEDNAPKLRKKKLTATEKTRIEATYCPTNGVYLNIFALKYDSSSWNRGEGTVLSYFVRREKVQIIIDKSLRYLDVFTNGGPISPMSYRSPMHCPF